MKTAACALVKRQCWPLLIIKLRLGLKLQFSLDHCRRLAEQPAADVFHDGLQALVVNVLAVLTAHQIAAAEDEPLRHRVFRQIAEV